MVLSAQASQRPECRPKETFVRSSQRLLAGLIASLAFCAGPSQAADSELLQFVAPDTRILIDIKVGRILNSPLGKEITPQLRATSPELQDILSKAKFDPTRDLEEILITGSGANSGPALMLARGNFDIAAIESFLPGSDKRTTMYEGATILSNPGHGAGAVAFIGNSILIGGDSVQRVQAAIRRRGQPTALGSQLAAKVRALDGRYDIWGISLASLGSLRSSLPSNSNLQQAAELLQSIQEISGGVRQSPDIEMSLEMVTKTEKDAQSLADGLKLITGLMTMNQQNKSGLKADSLRMEVVARTVRFSVHVPEEDVRKAYAEYRKRAEQGQLAAVVRPAPRPQPTGITIQSSDKDMGTVVLPPAKQN